MAWWAEQLPEKQEAKSLSPSRVRRKLYPNFSGNKRKIYWIGIRLIKTQNGMYRTLS